MSLQVRVFEEGTAGGTTGDWLKCGNWFCTAAP